MIFVLLLFSFTLQPITLQEAFDEATSFGEYEKYLVLNSDYTYTGGIGVYEGDIYLDCNGAIIDLQGGNGIWVYSDEDYPSSLEIKFCTIINSDYYGLSFGGLSTGSIRNCNFINTNFGLKLFDESDVNITNSIFHSNQSSGIAIYTEEPTLLSSYLLFWDNVENCMENCPG